MTKVLTIEVEGAKEAILKSFTRARKYVRSLKDATNWGVLIILVDEYDRPVVLDEANLTSIGKIAACQAIAMQETMSLIVHLDEEDVSR